MRTLVMSLLGLGLALGVGNAAVLCQKKNGVVVVRDPSCKGKERSLDLAAFGALGPKGDKGDKGDPGDPGAPGPLVTTLASGATLRGAFGGGWDESGGGQATELSFSYPFPLASSPAAIIISPGAPVPTGCSGSVANPGADAGNLCLFVAFSNGPCNGFASYGFDGMSDYRLGGVIYSITSGAGRCEFAGSWAVTAP